MKTTVPLRCLIVGFSLILVAGCSSSRGNLARNSSDAALSITDELDAVDTTPVKSASADSAVDGPPSQPGVKPAGGARNKLTSWMKKKDPKRESIPLERTDSASRRDDDDSLAEEDSGWWKQSDTPITADNLQARKSRSSATDSTNPFNQ